MNIRVGILGSSLGWVELLHQEGIPFAEVDIMDSQAQDRFSAIIPCRSASPEEQSFLRGYLRGGGAVVGFGGFCPGLIPRADEPLRIPYLLPDARERIHGLSLMDVEASGELPREANCLRTADGVFALYVGELYGGIVVMTPVDPGAAMEDFRATERYFYARPDRLPFERVSRVAKGEVLHLVHAALEYVHDVRGVPYVTLSPFPEGAENVFAFRIDTDRGTEKEVSEIYRIARDYEVGFTWFLDVASHASWLNRFADMEAQEIGLHCYDHRIYLDADRDAMNISRGIDAMKGAGLPPSSFAAPFGFWSPDFGRMIDREGFVYSSEFGWAYDTFPHYPATSAGKNMTLQIPVHPVSIGSLRRSGFTSAGMSRYYQEVVARKIVRGEPLFFYHHPGHHEWRVVRGLCDEIQRRGIRTLTLGGYASWWKERLSLSPSFTYDGSEVTVGPGMVSHSAGGVAAVLSRKGSFAAVPLGCSVALSMVDWKKREEYVVPADIKRIREFDLRGEIGRQFTRIQRRFP